MNQKSYMRAAVLRGVGEIEIADVAVPEPGPQDVLLKMRHAGICGSDLHIYTGELPGVSHPLLLGHEGVGIVEKCGTLVSEARLGQRVVIEPNFPCLVCQYCERGQGNICPNKRIFGVREPGCFAEYAIVPSEFAHVVPPEITDEDAVLVEPTAVAYHALRMSSAKPGDTIAIVGMGTIGLLLAHLALALNYQVLVNDRIQEKVDLAVRWGARPVSVESKADSISAFKEFYERANVRTVFEATGSGKGTQFVLASAPRGAEVVLVGLATEPVSIVPFHLTRNGNQILTSMIYDHPYDFYGVLALISSRKIQPSRIIASRTHLENLPETIRHLAQANAGKVILDLNATPQAAYHSSYNIRNEIGVGNG